MEHQTINENLNLNIKTSSPDIGDDLDAMFMDDGDSMDEADVEDDEVIKNVNKLESEDTNINLKKIKLEKNRSGRIDSRNYLLKLPGFISVVGLSNHIDGGQDNIVTFSPSSVEKDELSSFQGINEDGSGAAMLLKAATSIRWKMDGNDIKSNARLVQWSDDSWSLMIGKDHFQVILQNIYGDNQYIFSPLSKSPTEEGQVEDAGVNYSFLEGEFSQRMAVNPFICEDQSHRKYLVAATAATVKDSNDVRVKLAVTTVDPEKERQNRIRLEQENLRFRRKEESKKKTITNRNLDRSVRTGLSARFLDEDDSIEDSDDSGYGGGQTKRENVDEYEEDFIDDGEEDDNDENIESDGDEDTGDFESPSEDTEVEKSKETAVPSNKRRRAAIIDDD